MTNRNSGNFLYFVGINGLKKLTKYLDTYAKYFFDWLTEYSSCFWLVFDRVGRPQDNVSTLCCSLGTWISSFVWHSTLVFIVFELWMTLTYNHSHLIGRYNAYCNNGRQFDCSSDTILEGVGEELCWRRRLTTNITPLGCRIDREDFHHPVYPAWLQMMPRIHLSNAIRPGAELSEAILAEMYRPRVLIKWSGIPATHPKTVARIIAWHTGDCRMVWNLELTTAGIRSAPIAADAEVTRCGTTDSEVT
jgi:hypothetical protein